VEAEKLAGDANVGIRRTDVDAELSSIYCASMYIHVQNAMRGKRYLTTKYMTQIYAVSTCISLLEPSRYTVVTLALF